jgi:hypothetical protein
MMLEQWQQTADWAQRISERSAHEGRRKTTDTAMQGTDKPRKSAAGMTHRNVGVTHRNVEARMERYRHALLD